MSAFVIVTGPDNTGKTTLVKQLSEALGAPSEKFTRHSQCNDYMLALDLSGGSLNVVWDRVFWDEAVYQPVMRPGKPQIFTRDQWHMMELHTCLRSPVVVHCTNIMSDEDGYVKPYENRLVAVGYRGLMARLGNFIPVVEYGAVEGPENIIARVRQALGYYPWREGG